MLSRRAFIAAGAIALVPVVAALQAGATKLVEVNDVANAAKKKTGTYLDLSGFDADAQSFSSTLPILVLNTQEQELSADYRIRGTFQLIGDDPKLVPLGSTRYTLLDELTINCYADLNIRGHSSATLRKKSLRVALFKKEDSAQEKAESLLGMASSSDWVLYGPYQDISLIRNAFSYGLSRECMEWAPDIRWVELWLNGLYQGLYSLVEKIQIDEKRIQGVEYTTLSGDTSFLLAREIVGSNENEFDSFVNKLGHLTQRLGILYPKYDEITGPQQRFIEQYINEFECALYSDWYLDNRNGYRKYLDLDSWVTYFLLEEFSITEDTGYHSTYCYRSTGGQLKAGPVWDFNSSYDNYVGISYTTSGFYLINNTYFDRFCTDPMFVQAAIKKYREMRQGILSEDSLLERAKTCRAQIAEAIPRNDAVWGHYGTRTGLSGDERLYETYDQAYDQFESFLINRGQWLDEHIDELFLNCQYVKTGGKS